METGALGVFLQTFIHERVDKHVPFLGGGFFDLVFVVVFSLPPRSFIFYQFLAETLIGIFFWFWTPRVMVNEHSLKIDLVLN